MGVRRVPGTEGATMGPPADKLYAVEPDGVAMISPSACTPKPLLHGTNTNCTVMQQNTQQYK